MEPRTPKPQLARARKMRRDQPFTEEMLWRSLRDRQLGVQFRQQMPIGPFLADFVSVYRRVIVEVDGPSHETEEGKAHDARRDVWFRANGWRVVRVTNELVTGGGDTSADRILAVLAELDNRYAPLLRPPEKVSTRGSDERWREVPLAIDINAVAAPHCSLPPPVGRLPGRDKKPCGT